jgi:hypothetical protein
MKYSCLKDIWYNLRILILKLSLVTIILFFLVPNIVVAQRKGSLGILISAVSLEKNYDVLFKETLFPTTNFTFKYGFSRGVIKEVFLKNKTFLSLGVLYSTNFYHLRQEVNIASRNYIGVSTKVKIIKFEIPIQFRYATPLSENLDLVYALGVSLDYFSLNGRRSKLIGGVRFSGATSSLTGPTPFALNTEWFGQPKNLINPAFIPGLYLKYKGSRNRFWIFGITGHIYPPIINIFSKSLVVSGFPSVVQYEEKVSGYFAPNYISCQVQYMFSRKKK